MRQILYTSNDIRKAILRLFTNGRGRRVAITAFVGHGADLYLPRKRNRAEGIEVICWPREGTNPDALRVLLAKGVKVYFADSVHMKVYWSEGQGAILTSANMSRNALTLKEIGILLGHNEIDIDGIIKTLRIRPLSPKELLNLDRIHKTHYTEKQNEDFSHKTLSFAQWHESPYRPQWKLAHFTDWGNSSSAAKAVIKKEHGLAGPYRTFFDKRKDFQEQDWVLLLRDPLAGPKGVSWFLVEGIINVPDGDKAFLPQWPYEFIQLSTKIPPPPFRTNAQFQRALYKAVERHGGFTWMDGRTSGKLSDDFLDLLYKYYKHGERNPAPSTS